MATSAPLLSFCYTDHQRRLIAGLWRCLQANRGTDMQLGSRRMHSLMLDVFNLSPTHFLSVTTSGIDDSDLNSLLEFLYTGRVVIGQDRHGHLLQLARRANFTTMVQTLEKSDGVVTLPSGGQDVALAATTSSGHNSNRIRQSQQLELEEKGTEDSCDKVDQNEQWDLHVHKIKLESEASATYGTLSDATFAAQLPQPADDECDVAASPTTNHDVIKSEPVWNSSEDDSNNIEDMFRAASPVYDEQQSNSIPEVSAEEGEDEMEKAAAPPPRKKRRKPAVKKLYECDVCQRSFSSRAYVQIHTKREHSGQELEKPHQCEHCDKAFAERSNLTAHVRTHTQERPYKCDLCPDTAFSQRQHLVRHRQTHTGEKPHQCSECGKRFSQKQHLKLHKRTHTGERPHVCSICQLAFADRFKLKLHQRTHSGLRPFKCEYCPLAFTAPNILARHTRTHTGEKPYACSWQDCTRHFASHGELCRHTRSHGGEKNFVCGGCHRTFSSRYNCTKHVLKCAAEAERRSASNTVDTDSHHSEPLSPPTSNHS